MHAHVEPGGDGTKELSTRFGQDLLYVRYRYDDSRRERVKTVELVGERKSRDGDLEDAGSRTSGAGAVVVASRWVALRIGWKERDLQRRVKSAGGRSDPNRWVWTCPDNRHCSTG